MLFNFLLISIFLVYVALMIVIVGRRFFPTPKSKEIGSPGLDGAESDPLIEMVEVHKAFDHPVLKGISLQINPGEIVGVLGKSGTGKSVLLKLAVALLKPDKGKVLFRGQDITAMTEAELLQVRKQVSYVFQSGAIFDFLNVRENIAYSLREQGVTDEQKIAERVDYLLNAVEMEGLGDLQSEEMGPGSKKQVAIARAIANNPRAILFDEPTTGVDPIVGKSLSRLIRKINDQENFTSVVVTHDLKCLEIVADRIILLKDGYIHFEGDQEEFHSSSDPFIQAFIEGKRYDEPQVQAPRGAALTLQSRQTT